MTARRSRTTTAAILATVAGGLLFACVNGTGPKQTVGALGGAALGGLAGAQIGAGTGKLAATGAGVFLGGLLGSEVGKSLDRADRIYMARTTQSTLEYRPSGTRAAWRNPDTGHYGTVEPMRTYRTSSGRYCREFYQTVEVGGRIQEAYGTACRQPDGTWQIVQ